MILADPDAMIAAAVAARPDLAGLSTVVHDGGWDSVAIAFGDSWLCKFPRDDDGPDALRREAALLAAIRPHLTIAVPDMTMTDTPVPFTCHRLLPGTALSSEDYAALDPVQRQALGEAVGGFLAELHAADGDWAAIGIGAEDEGAIDVAAALALLPPDLHRAAYATLDGVARLGPDPLGTGLCYLDAHGGNFAIDPVTRRLNGIFDFGDAAIAPRHAEFVEPAYVSRDFALRVITAYEVRTGARVDRERVALMIGEQRLRELAEDADHPVYGALILRNAIDWFTRPSLG